MDVRRRTLAAEGPLGNALPPSQIPVPSSAMKKPPPRLGNGRMSMAPGGTNLPGPKRVSSATNLASAAMNGAPIPTLSHSASQDQLRRSTIVPSQGAAVGATSGARGDAGVYGRTPQSGRVMAGGSVRRSSVYSGRQSLAPVMHAPTRDSRPLKTAMFQQAAARNIESFCRNNRCPITIHEKFWTGSATTKDFQGLVKWLIGSFIDEGYPWNRKFEDDCVTVLKDLRYPGLDGISKTTLGSLGSGSTWMVLVGMLNWLVELCKAHMNWEDPEIVSDPFRIPARDLSLDSPFLQDRIMWDFVSSVYENWLLRGAENFDEAEQELEEAYDRIAQGSFEENEKLETELQKRTMELQQLQAQEPPLKKLQEEHLQLMSDQTKFIAFLELHKTKAEKHVQSIEKCKQIMITTEEQIAMARAEQQHIESQVAAQNMSGDEVQRMYHERETLTRNLDELKEKINEASKFSYDQEMAVSRAQDRFDQLVTDYTAIGYSIGVIGQPSEGPSLGPGNVDFGVDIKLGGDSVEEIQSSGKVLRQTIWPALQSYGEQFRKEMIDVENGNIALDDQYDRLAQDVEKQKEEETNRQVRLKVINEQAEDAKKRLEDESRETNRTVAKLEKEVSAMIASSQESVAVAKSALEHQRIEFQELRHKTALLQDSVMKDITSHIEIIMKAKEHTQNSLRGVRAFAESQ